MKDKGSFWMGVIIATGILIAVYFLLLVPEKPVVIDDSTTITVKEQPPETVLTEPFEPEEIVRWRTKWRDKIEVDSTGWDSLEKVEAFYKAVIDSLKAGAVATLNDTVTFATGDSLETEVDLFRLSIRYNFFPAPDTTIYREKTIQFPVSKWKYLEAGMIGAGIAITAYALFQGVN